MAEIKTIRPIKLIFLISIALLLASNAVFGIDFTYQIWPDCKVGTHELSAVNPQVHPKGVKQNVVTPQEDTFLFPCDGKIHIKNILDDFKAELNLESTGTWKTIAVADKDMLATVCNHNTDYYKATFCTRDGTYISTSELIYATGLNANVDVSVKAKDSLKITTTKLYSPYFSYSYNAGYFYFDYDIPAAGKGYLITTGQGSTDPTGTTTLLSIPSSSIPINSYIIETNNNDVYAYMDNGVLYACEDFNRNQQCDFNEGDGDISQGVCEAANFEFDTAAPDGKKCCGDDGNSDTGTLTTDGVLICTKTVQADGTVSWKWAHKDIYAGDIFYMPFGSYDVVSDKNKWYVCNITGNLGNFISDGTNIKSESEKIFISEGTSTHDYLCYFNASDQENPIQQFGECIGNGQQINTQPNGAVFTAGQSISNTESTFSGASYPPQQFTYTISSTGVSTVIAPINANVYTSFAGEEEGGSKNTPYQACDAEKILSKDDAFAGLIKPHSDKNYLLNTLNPTDDNKVSSCVIVDFGNSVEANKIWINYKSGALLACEDNAAESCSSSTVARFYTSTDGQIWHRVLADLECSGETPRLNWRFINDACFQYYQQGNTCPYSQQLKYVMVCRDAQGRTSPNAIVDNIYLETNPASFTYQNTATTSANQPVTLGPFNLPLGTFTLSVDNPNVIAYFSSTQTTTTTKQDDTIYAYTEYSEQTETPRPTYTYYCTSDGRWVSSLDNSDDATCTESGDDWTGNYCCGEWNPRYFNDDVSGCWYTQELENNRADSIILNKNHGFEYGLVDGNPKEWYSTSYSSESTSAHVTGADSGANSRQGTILKLQNSETNTLITLWSDLIPIDSRTDYNLSAWVKGDNVAEIKLLFYEEDKQCSNSPCNLLIKSEQFTEWTQINKIVSASDIPQDKKYVRILLSSIGSAYEKFDDVTLTPAYKNIINYEGQFYGCSIDQESELLTLTDQKTSQQLITNQNTCAVQGDFFCSPKKIWESPSQLTNELGESIAKDTLKNIPESHFNLIPNPSFEEVKNGFPVSWSIFQGTPAQFSPIIDGTTGTLSFSLAPSESEGSAIQSDFIEVISSNSYRITTKTKGETMRLELHFYDSFKNDLHQPTSIYYDASTNWKQTTNTITPPAESKYLRIRIVLVHTPPYEYLYIDDFSMHELIIDENLPNSSCCPSAYCWNGEQCIPSESNPNNPINQIESGSGKFLCIDGNWQFMAKKYTWDNSQDGYCPSETQCLVDPDGNALNNNRPETYAGIADYYTSGSASNPQCISSSQFIGDHYCDNGEWTSRTKLIALQLLDFANSINPTNYVLFCDSYALALNDYNYPLQTGITVEQYLKGISTSSPTPATILPICQNGNEFPCVNNFCILKYDDGGNEKVLFGVSLNQEINNNTLPFLHVLGQENNYCNSLINTGSDFAECSNNPQIWYSDPLNSVIYSKQNIDLNPTIADAFATFLKNPIITIINKMIAYLSTSTPPEDISYASDIKDYNRLYINRYGSKSINAVIEKATNPETGLPAEFMTAKYSGFSPSLNICASAKKAFGSQLECTAEANTFYMFSNDQTVLAKWPDFTSVLRLQ